MNGTKIILQHALHVHIMCDKETYLAFKGQFGCDILFFPRYHPTFYTSIQNVNINNEAKDVCIAR